jgi:hypothetical protein
VLRKRRGRSAAVLARNESDTKMRKGQARISGLDTPIIPLVDSARENIDIDVAGKVDLAIDAGNIVRNRDHTGRDRAFESTQLYQGNQLLTGMIASRLRAKSFLVTRLVTFRPA